MSYPEGWVQVVFWGETFLTYPLVNKHSNGISPSLIGNTSSKGPFSIAMLDYRSVTWEKPQGHLGNTSSRPRPTARDDFHATPVKCLPAWMGSHWIATLWPRDLFEMTSKNNDSWVSMYHPCLALECIIWVSSYQLPSGWFTMLKSGVELEGAFRYVHICKISRYVDR